MKRTVLVGVAMFLLGGAASPRAANNDETLALLCKRFDDGPAGKQLAFSTRRVNEDHKARGTADENLPIAVALESVRAIVCVK